MLRVGSSLAVTVLLTACGAVLPGVSGRAAEGLGAKSRGERQGSPSWAKDAVFYQIFPDRFNNGDPSNDPVGTEPWGGKPTYTNFFGGDLAGIRSRLDHLKALGVTALYLNPIFQAPSNHKYDTTDYLRIDPAFGDEKTFKALVSDLHARGMRIILDGVFNHTGDQFAGFREAARVGPSSPFWNWYNFYGFPVVQQPKPNYDSWWGFATLPKLNFRNPRVRSYILDTVVPYWTRMGIDGWRLDVPNEISEPGFWEDFRTRVLALNPEAYLVGEIWDDPRPWLGRFDATMNYPFQKAVVAFAAKRTMDVDTLDRELATQRSWGGAATNAMFNILGSHDVERFRFEAGEQPRRHQAAVMLQMTYPGTPVVYYGDEIGMTGGKDPDDRRCFPWQVSRWDNPTFKLYRDLIRTRSEVRALRDGWFQTLLRHNDRRLWAYLRDWSGDSRALVVVNSGDGTGALDVPVERTSLKEGTQLRDALSGRTAVVRGGVVKLPDVGTVGSIWVAAASRK
ncbi:MAG: glycoside hydrolase family 13 protein [Candidatus Sericytochromatia bacterium]|nr:glycoside hydrolase family 13 protein [Candidatus Sericytochromatia bacterium]